MSLFLGPIHHLVFNTIKNQESLLKEIVDSFELYDLKNDMDSVLGDLPDDKLENIIDQDNIHGWLSEKVDLANKRFAYFNSLVLKNDLLNKDSLLDSYYKLGLSLGQDTGENIQFYFETMKSYFIDGMPCDFVLKENSLDKDRIVWTLEEVKKPYYSYQIHYSIYYDIRDSFMKGLLEKSPFAYKRDSLNFSIERK